MGYTYKKHSKHSKHRKSRKLRKHHKRTNKKSKARKTYRGGQPRWPAPFNPAPPHPLPAVGCRFPNFRPLVLSQFGGRSRRVRTKRGGLNLLTDALKLNNLIKLIEHNDTDKFVEFFDNTANKNLLMNDSWMLPDKGNLVNALSAGVNPHGCLISNKWTSYITKFIEFLLENPQVVKKLNDKIPNLFTKLNPLKKTPMQVAESCHNTDMTTIIYQALHSKRDGDNDLDDDLAKHAVKK